MDPDREERLRLLQLRLNRARHENTAAASSELLRQQSHRRPPPADQTEIFDIPMRLLAPPFQTGPNSEDHLNDPDVKTYLKDLAAVPQSVYTDYAVRRSQHEGLPRDWKSKDDVAEGLAMRLRKKKEQLKKRNQRAADYDISGKYQVDFINDKNKRFNKRLAREYNEFTEDLRLNLERSGNV
jgi:hypothetical protein